MSRLPFELVSACSHALAECMTGCIHSSLTVMKWIHVGTVFLTGNDIRNKILQHCDMLYNKDIWAQLIKPIFCVVEPVELMGMDWITKFQE
jgi:hypothetical protein